MILLDTHVWVWWIDGGGQLPSSYRTLIHNEMPQGLAISAISLWEVAKLVELGRLQFGCPVLQWLTGATQPPLHVAPLTIEIAVASTQLPGIFHRDPADQMIVATARAHGWALVTMDQNIRAYPHVQLLP